MDGRLKVLVMDYEKRYKEAIERMKSWAKGEHPECFSEAQKTAEFIFPELKEIGDEKIRKELIAIYSVGAKVNAKTGDIYDKDIVAWLEKQGKKLDAAEVIEWIRNYASLFAANWVILDDIIEQFKKDFEL